MYLLLVYASSIVNTHLNDLQVSPTDSQVERAAEELVHIINVGVYGMAGCITL